MKFLLNLSKPLIHSHVQWNPSIAATLGEWHFGCYTEVAVVEGFYTGVKLNRDQGYCLLYSRWLAVVEGWPLREVPLYT